MSLSKDKTLVRPSRYSPDYVKGMDGGAFYKGTLVGALGGVALAVLTLLFTHKVLDKDPLGLGTPQSTTSHNTNH